MTRDTGADAGKVRTMEEFAAASGISRPTLSRFFNDPSSVRPASRERIEAAMRRFNYRPNLMAVNRNRRNPRTIGLLVPTLLDPFYAGLAQGIEKLASASGYWTILQTSHADAEGEAKALATLASLNVAGAILTPLGHASDPAAFRALAATVPIVFLDTRLGIDAPFVGTDNAQSMALMVDYLCRSGGSPVYFDMPDINANARERREAYAAAMRARGAEPRIVRMREKGWDFERIAFEAAARFFAGEPDAGTVLCANDRVAFGVMAAASQAGLGVGRGEGAVRVAGHDDHPLSRFSCPGLTTVAQDCDRLVEAALGHLMAAVANEGEHRPDPRLPATLVMRATA